MAAFGGGKTRKKYCSMKCMDRGRRRRINEDARSMGVDCYRIWLALLRKATPETSTSTGSCSLGTTGWRYAHMFRYRWSMARILIEQHFGDTGRAALRDYLDRATVKRWRVPRASLGINPKRSDEEGLDLPDLKAVQIEAARSLDRPKCVFSLTYGLDEIKHRGIGYDLDVRLAVHDWTGLYDFSGWHPVANKFPSAKRIW